MKSGHLETKRWIKLLLCALLSTVSAAAQAEDLIWRRPAAAKSAARQALRTARSEASDRSAADDETASAGEETQPQTLSRSATKDSKPIARSAAVATGNSEATGKSEARGKSAAAAPAAQAFEDPFGDEAPAPASAPAPQRPKRANRRVTYQASAQAPPPQAPPAYSQPRYGWNNGPYPGPAYQQPPYRPQYGPRAYPPQRNYLTSQPPEAELIEPGAPVMEGPYEGAGLENWPAAGGCEDGSCGLDGGCGPYCPWPPIFYASAMFGAQGFKSSVDRGQQGNFGVHEGFNLGAPLPLLDCHPLCHNIGMQFGMRFLQSNFQGDRATGAGRFLDERRYQTFLTAGLFRRANEYSPWQFGVAYDWQHDEYYYNEDFNQIRFEISRFGWCGNEFGVTLAFGGEERTLNAGQNDQFKLRPTNYYLLFLRRSLGCDGEWRVFAGPTDVGDGLFGAEFMLPVGDSLALEGSATFLIPDQNRSTGQREEGSAIGLNLVWYPYRRGRCAAGSPFRPLLGVADNGRFFRDRR